MNQFINETLVRSFPEWRDFIYRAWENGDDFWKIYDFILDKIGIENINNYYELLNS